jgi:dGTPase
VRRMIYSAMVDDVITNSFNNIEIAKIHDLEDVRKAKKFMVDFSEDMANQVKELKAILSKNIYNHPKILLNNKKAQRIISELFLFYFENPELISGYQKLLMKKSYNKTDLAYLVSDYVSGMTDRYAIQKHQENFDLYYLQPNFRVS